MYYTYDLIQFLGIDELKHQVHRFLLNNME
jgi:hypothetical protein